MSFISFGVAILYGSFASPVPPEYFANEMLPVTSTTTIKVNFTFFIIPPSRFASYLLASVFLPVVRAGRRAETFTAGPHRRTTANIRADLPRITTHLAEKPHIILPVS
jgi:hypothetical protein